MLRELRHKKLLSNDKKRKLLQDATNFCDFYSNFTEFEIDTIIQTYKLVMICDKTMWKEYQQQ